MTRDSSRRLLTALLLACTAAPLRAQDSAASTEQLRVFMDCSWYCDMDFLRTEINWVSYMRDRADAQVHILVTAQSTGGGGLRHTIEFIGLKDFLGVSDTLFYNRSSNDTDDITRRALANMFKIGLMRYIASTPLARHINIAMVQPERAAGATAAAAPQRDPWNFWTFRVGFNGNFSGEKSRESYRFSNSLSANRTTETWKLSFSVNGSYSQQSYTFPWDEVRDTTITSITRNYGLSTLMVRSVTPHLSIGARANASTSTYGNTSLSLSVLPAIEYNVFPYAESTRRQFTFMYATGMRRYEYRDTTIYLQTEETRPIHSLSVGFGTRQTWGATNISVDGSQYLHDRKKYNVGIFGEVSEIRLFKGFSFNMWGNYNVVRDQITLAKGTLTQDQVLLRQRELETGHRFFVSGGISYRFGSIFNNVVNPRFTGAGGQVLFID